jgi:hypothetical protein
MIRPRLPEAFELFGIQVHGPCIKQTIKPSETIQLDDARSHAPHEALKYAIAPVVRFSNRINKELIHLIHRKVTKFRMFDGRLNCLFHIMLSLEPGRKPGQRGFF